MLGHLLFPARFCRTCLFCNFDNRCGAFAQGHPDLALSPLVLGCVFKSFSVIFERDPWGMAGIPLLVIISKNLAVGPRPTVWVTCPMAVTETTHSPFSPAVW